MSKLDVDLEEDGVFVVEIRNKPAGENTRGTVVHEKRVFTSEEKYVEYGEANGFKFKEQLEFEKMMQDIAGAAGLIEEYDRTGEIPEWYIEREKTVYDSLFFSFKGVNAKVSNIAAALHEGFDGGGRSITIAATYPVMPPSWNDVVSCVEFFGAAGGFIYMIERFIENN